MHCQNCGKRNPDGVAFCAHCGTGLAPADAPRAAPAAASDQAAAPNAAAAADIYAGFWRRVAATLIDNLLLLPVVFVLALPLNAAGVPPGQVEALVNLVAFVGFWLYCAAFESSERQATLGKLALGLKVTGLDGGRISFARATGRYFAEILSGLTLGIGYVMVAFSRRRQALHDMVAGTVVVRRETAAATVAADPTPRTTSAGARALVVLPALVLPLAILAAIAIPAYHDYEIRAQVSDGLIEAGKHKEAVEAAIRGGSASSAIDSEALELPIEAASKYVEAIEVGSGAVAIVYGKEAATQLSGKTLALIPALDAERNFAWVCGYAAAPGGFDPVLGAHRQYTDVPKRLLPAQCRD